MKALRTVLLGILPDGVECIRAQQNRVPEPQGADFCIFSPILRTRLATNTDTYIDAPGTPPVGMRNTLLAMQTPGAAPIGLRNSLAPMQITVQIDVHGPSSSDNAQMISTLLRDEYACIEFARTGYDVQPLYADDPRETEFLNAEQMTEYRWSVDAVLQANPVIGTPQDFADVVVVETIMADGILSVDVVLPPPSLEFNAAGNAGLRMMGWN
jgi:hypothetical protein